MSSHYWITTTKEWLEQNFPELLCDATETGKDWLYEDDKRYFLKYMPENYGNHFVTEYNETGMAEVNEYLKAGRFAFPTLWTYFKKLHNIYD